MVFKGFEKQESKWNEVVDSENGQTLTQMSWLFQLLKCPQFPVTCLCLDKKLDTGGLVCVNAFALLRQPCLIRELFECVGWRMSGRNSVGHAVSFNGECGAAVGECAGSGMVWLITAPRDEGDVLKQVGSLVSFLHLKLCTV